MNVNSAGNVMYKPKVWVKQQKVSISPVWAESVQMFLMFPSVQASHWLQTLSPGPRPPGQRRGPALELLSGCPGRRAAPSCGSAAAPRRAAWSLGGWLSSRTVADLSRANTASDEPGVCPAAWGQCEVNTDSDLSVRSALCSASVYLHVTFDLWRWLDRREEGDTLSLSALHSAINFKFSTRSSELHAAM